MRFVRRDKGLFHRVMFCCLFAVCVQLENHSLIWRRGHYGEVGLQYLANSDRDTGQIE